MALAFHVVIERPREPGAAAAARLADAVAARYGIPAAQLRDRLAAGPLRVKSQVDRATADRFASDLEKLGAVVSLIDAATGQTVARPRPAAPAPAPAPVDLGAIASGNFRVSTLDGADDAAPAPRDDAFMPASFGPAASPAPPAAPAAAPLADPFAPPDAEPEIPLDLDVAPREPKRPGKLADPVAIPSPGRLAQATPLPAAAPPVPERPAGLAGRIADARVRLAAGVLLAILVGFVPAHVVASVREDSAYAQIDREVQQRYRSVLTEEDWDALDPMLARARERKQDERRSIALGSLVVWALVGGGVAFAWFRRIDWDAISGRQVRAAPGPRAR